jgi:peptidoglycan/LPS O-acetylase OafA/YrhL
VEPANRHSRQFQNIDVLRALAALAVLIYHVIELGHWRAFPFDGPLVVFRLGWLGVDLFFVISGFVITYSALLLVRDSEHRFAQAFWLRRLSRIVPLHLLTMAVWLAFAGPGLFDLAPRVVAWQLGAHVAFVHNFWPATYASINGINWTLAIEMQFYLGVALFVRWIDRTPGWRILAYCVVVAWTWRACMMVLHGYGDLWRLFTAVTQLPGQLDEFGAGIFLAKLVLTARGRTRSASVLWLLGAWASGYAAMALYWPRATYWNFPAMVVFWRSAAALFFLCIVASAVSLPQTIATRWLRPLRYLGEVSYGIYLWQLVAIDVALAMVGPRPPVVLAIALALTIAIAALSWRCFEKPIMRLARASSVGLRRDARVGVLEASTERTLRRSAR